MTSNDAPRGWTFRVDELSAGVYRLYEDDRGRTIEATGLDSDAMKQDALATVRRWTSSSRNLGRCRLRARSRRSRWSSATAPQDSRPLALTFDRGGSCHTPPVFGRRFGDLTDTALKELADLLVRALSDAPPDQQERALQDIAMVRDEMIERLRGRGDDGTSGVREPRKPQPGGGAAGVAIEPDD